MVDKHSEDVPAEITSSNSKRKLLKGAAAAPLLMTVASRPVLARGICTPSAWVSGNLSDHHQAVECGGRSPGYWKTNPDAWPGQFKHGTCDVSSQNGKHKSYAVNNTCKVYLDDGTKFSDVFGSGFPGKTMMQVLWLGGNDDPYQLGAHIVAALLNAATISDYGMTEQDVINLYKYNQFGFTSEEMVDFIQQTFS